MEFVSAIGHALDDNDWHVRWRAIQIFTAALAQGMHTSIFRVLLLKYFQRAFGTKYLILRLSLHLDLH